MRAMNYLTSACNSIRSRSKVQTEVSGSTSRHSKLRRLGLASPANSTSAHRIRPRKRTKSFLSSLLPSSYLYISLYTSHIYNILFFPIEMACSTLLFENFTAMSRFVARMPENGPEIFAQPLSCMPGWKISSISSLVCLHTSCRAY